MMATPTARTAILLRQILWRSTGCDISHEKVPRLNSRPNESTPIRMLPKKKTIGDQLMTDPFGFQIHGRKIASDNTVSQLGSNNRISFLTSAFMFSSSSKCPTPRKSPPTTARSEEHTSELQSLRHL